MIAAECVSHLFWDVLAICEKQGMRQRITRQQVLTLAGCSISLLAVGAAARENDAYGVYVVLRAIPRHGQKITSSTMQEIMQRLLSRIHRFAPMAQVSISDMSGPNQLVSVQLRGFAASDTLQRVESLLETTGLLTLVALGNSPLPSGATVKGQAIIVNSGDVDPLHTKVVTDQSGQPALGITLRKAGAERLQVYTAQHIGEYLGIAIDDRIYSSALIQSRVAGRLMVHGLGSLSQLNALVICLAYPLPIDLHIEHAARISS